MLNLKEPGDLAVLKKLILKADVFVQNFRPGVAQRLGLGVAELRDLNPALVYMSISGFGFTGPLADKPAYDPLVQALSSLTTVQAGSDEKRPRLVRTILPDKLTGVHASQAISAALYAREKTGEGQAITLNMLDTMVSFLWHSDMNGHTFVDEVHENDDDSQSFADLIYQVQDGYISISVMQDKHWKGLAKATSRMDILNDSRFNSPELRETNREARLALTQSIIAKYNKAELLENLERNGVPCAPILSRKEMLAHPQLMANQTLVEYTHPLAGTIRQARAPAVFSGSPTCTFNPAPSLGEHTDEVIGGLDD